MQFPAIFSTLESKSDRERERGGSGGGARGRQRKTDRDESGEMPHERTTPYT